LLAVDCLPPSVDGPGAEEPSAVDFAEVAESELSLLAVLDAEPVGLPWSAWLPSSGRLPWSL
jgi:hypothetical protein